jgi:hypothetical protein
MIPHGRREACGCFDGKVFHEDPERVNAVPPAPEVAGTPD